MNSPRNKKAYELIEQCKNTKNKKLDLSYCGLTEIPFEISALTWLEELILSNEYWDFENQKVVKGANYQEVKEDSPFEDFKIEPQYNQKGAMETKSYFKDQQKKPSLDPNQKNFIREERLPKFLYELRNLKTFRCGGWMEQWNIENIRILGDLGQLQLIDMSNNKIEDIGSVYRLEHLKIASFNANNIHKLPDFKHFKNLEHFDAQNNSIEEIAPIFEAPKLKYLELRNNSITDISGIDKMAALSTLHLQNNQIEDLAPIVPMLRTDRLEVFNFDRNPLNKPPYEIYQEGAATIIRWYDRFYKEKLKKESLQPIQEIWVKLILLGNSRAGKTQFSGWLRGVNFEDSSTTHGMQVERWQPDYKIKDKTIDGFIYDFGGQEYYHDTHNLFFTNHALYCLLWEQGNNSYDLVERDMGDGNTEMVENHSHRYWLGSIQYLLHMNDNKQGEPVHAPQKITYPANSPLALVVQNKIDLHGRHFLNEADIYNDFRFVYDFYSISLYDRSRCAQLEKTLKEVLEQHFSSSTIFKFWKAIRLAIENDQRFLIDFKTFFEICLEHQADLIEDEAKDICRYFTNMGIVLVLDKDIQADTKVFIQPAELSKVIYKILDKKILSKSEGVLKKSQVKKLINDFHVGEEDFYLQLLQEYKLLFRHPSSTNTFIVPQYLPSQPNEEIAMFSSAFDFQSFQYQYGYFIHRNIVMELFDKLIKRLYLPEMGRAKQDFYCWKNGFILSQLKNKDEKILLYIAFDKPNQRLDIRTMEPYEQIKTYVDEVIQDIDDVNKNYPSVKKRVSLNGSHFIDFDFVKSKHEQKIPFFFSKIYNKKYRTADYRQFLDLKAYPMQKVFIAFAKDDESYKEELLSHLSPLKRNGLIDTWHTGMIEMGEKPKEVIQEQLSHCDMLIVLLSASLMANDDIVNEIIPNANKKEGMKVLPILVRNCLWEDLKTKDGKFEEPIVKTPIAAAADKDLAWTEVIHEIKTAFET